MAQSTNEALITLLRIYDPDASPAWDIYLCDDESDITSNGQVYTAFQFSATMPSDTGSDPRTNITLSAVDQTIIDDLRSVNEPPMVDLSMILLSTPDTVEIGPLSMRVTSFTATERTITLVARFDSWKLEGFPWVRFSPQYFPGLFN